MQQKFILLCAISILALLTACNSKQGKKVETTGILIVGGGASGTTAGIQSARMGVKTFIVEEHEWLGGMLTSAGVSAIDGNYNLNSGLWNEFRQNIYNYYGGADKVKTGWVSSVLFEPSVANAILKKMVANEPNLSVRYQSILTGLKKEGNKWVATFDKKNGSQFKIEANLVIDATELGDVAKMAGISYRVGMDAKSLTGEDIALDKPNNIIQDLTYVAILKDYGQGTDKTIAKPDGYNREQFLKTSAGKVSESDKILYPPEKMIDYGRLPNGKYMINWPIYGNDFYLNIIDLPREEREKALQAAKNHTLQYIYYLQTELGFKTLGLANDEYPTPDKLPFIPYHRESRRIVGEVLFTLNHIAKPFIQEKKLYRTGIAVGDYPVDHHHSAYSLHHNFPDLHFYPVPSYALPLGSLIPKGFDDFIVAEKSISVSNIVNGTTRLQPVCLLIGQAAGALAAISVKNGVQPREVPVRQVQNVLLNASAYILPYVDVKPNDACFNATQKIGATGILKYVGISEGWTNKSYFYPDSTVSVDELKIGLAEYEPSLNFNFTSSNLTVEDGLSVIGQLLKTQSKEFSKQQVSERADEVLQQHGLRKIEEIDYFTRAEFAVVLNAIIDPFNAKNIDLNGYFRN